MSSECGIQEKYPHVDPLWLAVMSQEEEDKLERKLNPKQYTYVASIDPAGPVNERGLHSIHIGKYDKDGNFIELIKHD